jgi:hypothetical protein
MQYLCDWAIASTRTNREELIASGIRLRQNRG